MQPFTLIGNATDAHIQQIAEIESRLFEDAWQADSIKSLLSQSINDALLLMQQDSVIAYCLYQKIFETAEILRIATHPDLQRQGFGKQLLQAWLQQMHRQAATHLLLEVRADNTAAITLYQTLGFKKIDTRRGYYKSLCTNQPIDAWIMQCVLDSMPSKTELYPT